MIPNLSRFFAFAAVYRSGGARRYSYLIDHGPSLADDGMVYYDKLKNELEPEGLKVKKTVHRARVSGRCAKSRMSGFSQ